MNKAMLLSEIRTGYVLSIGIPVDVSVPFTVLKPAGLSLTFELYQEKFMVFYTLPAAVAFTMVTGLISESSAHIVIAELKAQ